MPPSPVLSLLLMLLALVLALISLAIGLRLHRRGIRSLTYANERHAEATEIETRNANTLPTTITVTRDGETYECTWVRFTAVMPAHLGKPQDGDVVQTSPDRPAGTELTVIASGDVRELFEVMP